MRYQMTPDQGLDWDDYRALARVTGKFEQALRRRIRLCLDDPTQDIEQIQAEILADFIESLEDLNSYAETVIALVEAE